ncbi:hypothetical protein GQ457_04G033180 [Hibiscus cannabinus]
MLKNSVNSDLHFISWDNPPKQHPHLLKLADMQRMINSNAPFARKFPRDDPVLDKIDSELLSRGPDMFTPGGWCVGSAQNGSDPCSVVGNTTVIKPGPGATRLETLIGFGLYINQKTKMLHHVFRIPSGSGFLKMKAQSKKKMARERDWGERLVELQRLQEEEEKANFHLFYALLCSDAILVFETVYKNHWFVVSF